MKQISVKHLKHRRNQRRDQHRQDQRHVRPQQHQQQCPPELTQLLIQKEPHLHSQLSMKHLIIKKNRWHNQRYPDRPRNLSFFATVHVFTLLRYFPFSWLQVSTDKFLAVHDSLSQRCLLNIFSNKLFFKNVYGFFKSAIFFLMHW